MSSSVRFGGVRCRDLSAGLALLIAAMAAPLLACPFCTALRPTLSQQRAEAAVVAIGESNAATAAGQTEFRLHQVIAGKDRVAADKPVAVKTEATWTAGKPALLMAKSPADARPQQPLDWSAVAADETVLGYAMRAPSTKEPTAKRLPYFAKHLQHADATIAEDAYQEFAHTPYPDVAAVADALPQDKLRQWLADPAVPQHRKGFYAMALGLAKSESDRKENLAAIEKLLAAKDDGFRYGVDGAIGALLLLEGKAGLADVEKRYFADPKAKDIDVRHAVAALRFHWEFGPADAKEGIRSATRRLLARREFAPAAIIDLSRWEDWESVAKIIPLYDDKSLTQPATGQAVVAYLTACPKPEAAAALADLRRRDPTGVATAEQLIRFGGALRQ